MTSLLAFLFVLGVLIFVHELGHFMMARWHGVRVLTFSLGFGPKILRTQRGDTEYCISAIPLGGYVKMAGENADDKRQGAEDEFLSKTKWQRFHILIMGPAMNILLAVAVMAVVLYHGADVPAYEQQPPIIGSVQTGSPADRVGIREGDRVLRINDAAVDTWEQFFMSVAPRANRELEVVLFRDGREISVQVTPEAQGRFEMGDIGVAPPMHPQIRNVAPGQPADRSGLRPGDVVLRVDGEDVTLDRPLPETINRNAGVPLTLTIRRDGVEQDIVVTPELRGDVGLIGIELSPFEVRTIQPGPLQAVGMSVQRNWDYTILIFRTIWGLITQETSPRQLMGPVAIAQLSGGAAEVGWIALLSLMALISLNLGILNLLPIPVLDGGHIMIMAIEGLSRRDFSIRVKEKMLLAGFLVLIVLMVTVIYNDLTRIQWIERLMPWR